MNELVVFDEVAATIAEYKVKNEKLVFDYADKEGAKQARSHIASLRKVKTEISEVHKEAKAEALAFGRKLDAKKNEYTGEVDGMIAVHKDPLDAIEAEKQAVVDVEKRRLEEEEEKRLAELEAREAAVREAEEKIAKEKIDAERAEREKRIAEEAAETAKVHAKQKAKAEADAKELTEKKSKEAEEAKEQKRITNKKHRNQIELEVRRSLVEYGLSESEANVLLIALKNNHIKNVTINY